MRESPSLTVMKGGGESNSSPSNILWMKSTPAPVFPFTLHNFPAGCSSIAKVIWYRSCNLHPFFLACKWYNVEGVLLGRFNTWKKNKRQSKCYGAGGGSYISYIRLVILYFECLFSCLISNSWFSLGLKSPFSPFKFCFSFSLALCLGTDSSK